MTDTSNGFSNYRLLGPSMTGGKDEDLLKDCKADDEAIQRLQALLTEWLRMENLVVLTAAGCSIGYGGKGMETLENEVLQAVKKIDGLSQKALNIINPRIKKEKNEGQNNKADMQPKPSFEQWLSYLVNAVHLAEAYDSPIESVTWKYPRSEEEAPPDAAPLLEEGDPSDSDVATKTIDTSEIETLIRYISKAIYAECALTLPDEMPDEKMEAEEKDDECTKEECTGKNEADKKDEKAQVPPHLAFLSKLMARDSNLGRTHLFTLNYDTLFEQAVERLGIQYFDGFSGKANARFDPSVYGLDVYYPGELAEGRVRRFDKFLHFYKLHGSIHWKLKGREIHAQHGDIDKYTEYRKSTAAEKAQKLMCDNFAPDYEKFGILPTSNKFVQTLNMPYSHLFRAFQARLSAPQTFLMVLGYGFGDDHITRIIETALMNPALIMLVVEPNPCSKIIERICTYKELGKRAFVLTPSEDTPRQDAFKHATFDDFAKNIMPDIQWLDDFLKLRQFEKKLQKNQNDASGDANALQSPQSPPNNGSGEE